jgi:hypothetical protein
VAKGALGRRKPPDWQHIDKYPYSLAEPATIAVAERTLPLPSWHWTHNQGHEGSCVGHGSSMERSIINQERYNPLWLWDRAKEIDTWSDTNPGDDNGTSVRAAYDVLRMRGHVPAYSMRLDPNGDPYVVGEKPVSYSAGVETNRWAVTVDEMRTAIALGNAVTIGVDWYSNFDTPVQKNKTTWFIGQGSLGSLRGGHSVCVYGVSDRRQAFKIKNSWGREYPLVWMPYETMQRLLDQDGEATLQTDR